MSSFDELSKRISELEQQINKAKVYGGALTLALLVGLGISWAQMPGLAKSAAEDSVKGSVLEEAKKAAQARLKDLEQIAEKVEATAASRLAAIEEAARKAEGAAGRAENAADAAEASLAKLSVQLSPSTWPHAINCGPGTTLFVLHGAPRDMTGQAIAWYVQVFPGEYRWVQFNGDGSYRARNGDAGSSALCEGKSIPKLRQEGRTYQFIAR